MTTGICNLTLTGRCYRGLPSGQGDFTPDEVTRDASVPGEAEVHL
jgi:hypothetical protein